MTLSSRSILVMFLATSGTQPKMQQPTTNSRLVCLYQVTKISGMANFFWVRIGVMFQELSMNFKLFQKGEETFKTRFYVGHDGSMVRLASGLGFGKLAPLRWPALGSEIVMEVRLE